MTCSKARELISAHLDRELAGSESLSLQRHVALCPACLEEQAALLEIKAALGGLPVELPAPDFEERLVRRVMIAGPAEARRSYAAYGAAGLGVAAAIGAFVALHARGVEASVPSAPPVAAARPAQSRFGPSRFEQAYMRDRAFSAASDPLNGPQVAVAASYARP